jgi:hypothetical protein
MTAKKRSTRRKTGKCAPRASATNKRLWALFRRDHTFEGMTKTQYKEAVRKHWKPYSHKVRVLKRECQGRFVKR